MLRLLHISPEVERTVLPNILMVSQSLLVGLLDFEAELRALTLKVASPRPIILVFPGQERRRLPS